MIRTCVKNIIRQKRRFYFSSSLKKKSLPTVNITSSVTNKNQPISHVRCGDQSKTVIRFFSKKNQPINHVRCGDQSKTVIRFFSTTDNTFTMEYEISCNELHEDINNNKSVYVIDVRESSEIDTQGKIPGSFLIPCKSGSFSCYLFIFMFPFH